MKAVSCLWCMALLVPLALVGCGDGTNDKPKAGGTSGAVTDKAKTGHDAKAAEEEVDEAEIKDNLAKLSPEDRKLAEEQRFCAVQNTSRLGGSMGTPVKLVLNGQTVFLCCGHCKKPAEKDPEKTLAAVKELKAKNAGTPAK